MGHLANAREDGQAYRFARGEEAAPFDCVQADLRVTSDHSVGIIGGMGHDSQNLAFQ